MNYSRSEERLFNHSGDFVDKVLKILILENHNTDANLIEHELHKGEILFLSRRAQTKEDFLRELKVFTPDFILSDYKLPLFDGSSAISIAKEHCPDVLFIFVSGTIEEELSIEDKRF
jgi:two-component SAPR family response regulator